MCRYYQKRDRLRRCPPHACLCNKIDVALPQYEHIIYTAGTDTCTYSCSNVKLRAFVINRCQKLFIIIIGIAVYLDITFLIKDVKTWSIFII